jgi:hypothetical protein
MIDSRRIYTCDCCNKKAQRKEVEGSPKGWVRFIRENPMLDRDFDDYDICDRCVKDIDEARAH